MRPSAPAMLPVFEMVMLRTALVPPTSCVPKSTGGGQQHHGEGTGAIAGECSGGSRATGTVRGDGQRASARAGSHWREGQRDRAGAACRQRSFRRRCSR